MPTVEDIARRSLYARLTDAKRLIDSLIGGLVVLHVALIDPQAGALRVGILVGAHEHKRPALLAPLGNELVNVGRRVVGAGVLVPVQSRSRRSDLRASCPPFRRCLTRRSAHPINLPTASNSGVSPRGSYCSSAWGSALCTDTSSTSNSNGASESNWATVSLHEPGSAACSAMKRLTPLTTAASSPDIDPDRSSSIHTFDRSDGDPLPPPSPPLDSLDPFAGCASLAADSLSPSRSHGAVPLRSSSPFVIPFV